MKKTALLWILILTLSLLTACGRKNPPPATFDITGTWEFRMSEPDKQDTVYDSGIITLTGGPESGKFSLTSDNGNEYSGVYVVSGIAFSIESDVDFIVQGSFPDEDNLFGTWETEETGGLWTAVRK